MPSSVHESIKVHFNGFSDTLTQLQFLTTNWSDERVFFVPLFFFPRQIIIISVCSLWKGSLWVLYHIRCPFRVPVKSKKAQKKQTRSKQFSHSPAVSPVSSANPVCSASFASYFGLTHSTKWPSLIDSGCSLSSSCFLIISFIFFPPLLANTFSSYQSLLFMHSHSSGSIILKSVAM